MNYCTVTHFHYSQLVLIHSVEQNVGQLYISTCIQDILYILLMCVNILLYICFVLMHCSQSCYSLYCYPRCTSLPNLSFNFLCCCFYLYIDGFYIWYVLIYLNITSVLRGLNSPFAVCHLHSRVCVSFSCVFAAIHHFRASLVQPNHRPQMFFTVTPQSIGQDQCFLQVVGCVL